MKVEALVPSNIRTPSKLSKRASQTEREVVRCLNAEERQPKRPSHLVNPARQDNSPQQETLKKVYNESQTKNYQIQQEQGSPSIDLNFDFWQKSQS